MHPRGSEDRGSVEAPEERQARYASYALAAFAAREKSQRLVGAARRTQADVESARVEQRLLTESKAWFLPRPVTDA
jgi:hypothetical protein